MTQPNVILFQRDWVAYYQTGLWNIVGLDWSENGVSERLKTIYDYRNHKGCGLYLFSDGSLIIYNGGAGPTVRSRYPVKHLLQNANAKSSRR